MKSNRASLKNLDIFKNFKLCLLILLYMFLIGTVSFCILGFNYGFDFTGGTQLVVSFPYDDTIQTQTGLEKTTNDIKTLLYSNDVRVNTVQVLGEDYNKCLVFTFKSPSDENLADIRIELNKKYNPSSKFAELTATNTESKILTDENYIAYDITNKTAPVESLIAPHTLLVTISALVFALVIVVLYALFRFKTVGALTIAFGAIADVLITASVICVARVEINTYFFAVLALIEMISIYTTASILYNTRKREKEPLYADKSHHEVIASVVGENLSKKIISFVSIGVICAVLGILCGLNVWHVALSSFVGLFVVGFTHLLVLPAFYANLSTAKELSSKANVETNNTDKNAEEVVVEEPVEVSKSKAKVKRSKGAKIVVIEDTDAKDESEDNDQ